MCYFRRVYKSKTIKLIHTHTYIQIKVRVLPDNYYFILYICNEIVSSQKWDVNGLIIDVWKIYQCAHSYSLSGQFVPMTIWAVK